MIEYSQMGLFDLFVTNSKDPARNTNVCPYCSFKFAEPPKRKTKCKKCQGDLYVRTKQTIFNSDLLTEEDSSAVDFFEDLKYLGATEDDYRKTEEGLRNKWGLKPKSSDVVWGVSTRLIGHPPKVGSSYEPEVNLLQHAKDVTFLQAKYIASTEKDPSFYLQTAHNYDIQINDLRDFGVTHFSIETGGCCDACSKQQGKKYSSQQLKESPILPISECTNKLNPESKFSWCLCGYRPIVGS